MELQGKSRRYTQWVGPEEMHADTVQWLSELKFIRDEQLFLNGLVKHYTTSLAQKAVFERARKLISELLEAEKNVVVLMKKVQAHENQLEIMVDDIDQPRMEQAYRETHQDLILAINSYIEGYRALKKMLFDLVSEVLRKDKQHRLLN